MPPNIVRVSLDILPFEGLACREAGPRNRRRRKPCTQSARGARAPRDGAQREAGIGVTRSSARAVGHHVGADLPVTLPRVDGCARTHRCRT